MALAEKIKKKIHLRVITPTDTKVDEPVDMVILRTVTGDMGILPEHEAYLCALDDGVLRILEGEGERRLAVYGGLAEVQGDAVTILTEEAQRPEEIDLNQAKAMQEEIQREMEEGSATDRRTQQAKLRRTMVKIEVASFSSR